MDAIEKALSMLMDAVTKWQRELEDIKAQLKAQPGVPTPSEADNQLAEIEAEIAGRRQQP